MVNSNTAALAMSEVATFPRMARLPREALRLARRIARQTNRSAENHAPKAVRLRRDPRKAIPKKATLNKIIVLSAIAPTSRSSSRPS